MRSPSPAKARGLSSAHARGEACLLGREICDEPRPAFTLIELLVVIAIITILASVFMPALARTQKRSYVANCVSNLRQMGMTFGLYTGDNAERYPFSGRVWPQVPFVDVWTLFDPYISTNNRGFYRCPADRGRGFNYEWVLASNFSITTNELPFSCSYYYYLQFYCADDGSQFESRRTSEVRFPSQKALCPCFVSSAAPGFDKIDHTYIDGHGLKGMLLLFSDAHSQFASYKQLNRTYLHPKYPSYNLDWTVGGLSGVDLK
jgi:prepilin-type N-terminal cleavage/methylation domain-containing protein